MPITKAPVAPPETTDTIFLDGGMELTTPKLALRPGHVVIGGNFEVLPTQGYGRIAGYERYDGHSPKPSDEVPTYVAVSSFVNPVSGIGAIVGGASSGATGHVASTGTNLLSLMRVSSAFMVGETVKEGATTIGVVVATPTVSEAEVARHRAAAADLFRSLILKVPGSGPVRGGFTAVFGGVDYDYAFRDIPEGTYKSLYKATTAGWVIVPLYSQIYFTAGGSGTPVDGQTLTQGSVTATIKRVVRQSGAWSGSTAAGKFVINNIVGGVFSAGAATAGSVSVTLSGASANVTLPPGGKFQFHKFNFSGSDEDKHVYGTDGVGPAIDFDGDVLVTIDTGTSPDTPSCVMEHKNRLMLGIGSSVIYSGPGLPHAFTAADGAGEIAVGDTITNLNRQPGESSTSTLGVYGKDSTQFLVGDSPSDWKLIPYKNGVGAYPHTSQTLNHAYVFDRNGLIDYRASSTFGNFSQSAITVGLQPFVNQFRAGTSCSVVERSKSQYRVFFSDGNGLFCTIVNGKFRGALPVQFAHAPYVAWEGLRVNGTPVSFFGGTDGMVYEMERGTSFDGQAIPYAIALSWYFGSNPRMVKRWRRALIEMEGTDYVAFDVGYRLAYGGLGDLSTPSNLALNSTLADSPLWNSFIWGPFFWAGSGPLPILARFNGSSTNIQLTISGLSDAIEPFTLSAITMNYTNRRMDRRS